MSQSAIVLFDTKHRPHDCNMLLRSNNFTVVVMINLSHMGELLEISCTENNSIHVMSVKHSQVSSHGSHDGLHASLVCLLLGGKANDHRKCLAH
jgi:hypothetical protein